MAPVRAADLRAAVAGVIPIQFTEVLWLGITVLCAGYVVLGVAVISEGARRTDHAIQIA